MPDLNFFLTSLIVVLLPGTGVVYTIATGVSKGRRASFWAALGCTLGIVPHLLATVFGLAALMHSSAIAFQVLKYIGVGYLLYLAIANLRETTLIPQDGEQIPVRSFQLVLKAMLINLLNPKLTLFFFAFLPQFISTNHHSPIPQLLILGLIFMLMTLVVFILYGLLAHALRQKVIESPTVQIWLKRTFAGVFLALGVKLALSEN